MKAFPLKPSLAVCSAVLLIGLAAPAGAALPDGEVLYLADSHTDTSPGGVNDGTTTLYRVLIDEVAGHANLQTLPGGTIPFNQVDAIAATPDGTQVFFFDRYTPGMDPNNAYYGTGNMGWYGVSDGDWHLVGPATEAGGGMPIPGVVLAGFSPGWDLYIASQTTNLFYRVDRFTGIATEVGEIHRASNDAQVLLTGADLAFTADGHAYLWTNKENPAGAPQGLYELDIPNGQGVVTATYVGSSEGEFFTGVAMRANGFGDMAGSTTIDPNCGTGNPVDCNEIHVQSLTSAADVGGSPYPMYLDGQAYDYRYGDMTNGLLGRFCTRTIGYWKNHDWPFGIFVCGVPVDQAYGQEILSAAKNNNYSMLIAQLIGAKLNTGATPGVDFVDSAEAWLCQQEGITDVNQQVLNYDMRFSSKSEKATATGYKDTLDSFNNTNECN